MKRHISLFWLFITIAALEGCGGRQALTFEPVARLDQSKYGKDNHFQKNFYRSGVLEKRDQPTGFFWKLKTKI